MTQDVQRPCHRPNHDGCDCTAPAKRPDVPAQLGPVPMDHHEKTRLRHAAFYATRVYPGPVGELVARELLTWEEFGYRLGGRQLVNRLVDHILKAPIPGYTDAGTPRSAA